VNISDDVREVKHDRHDLKKRDGFGGGKIWEKGE
jgi:hypothetical protein